jgi:serine/threonine-protein kinase
VLGEKIASGGMGTVYKAQHIHKKSGWLAVKILHEELMKNSDLIRRFKQESELIDQLNHPHIVKVFERGELKEQLFMVMEYVSGKTLAEKIAEYGCYPLAEALHVIGQLVEVVGDLHTHQIIHRDLKPDNIILTEHQGDSHFVKLLDFGLAKNLFAAKMTMTGMALGTLCYMSKEQACEELVTFKADIYSLGVIIYQMLTGQLPFSGDDQTAVLRQILAGHVLSPRQIRNSIPEELDFLILSMLDGDPAKRPSTEEITFMLGTITI